MTTTITLTKAVPVQPQALVLRDSVKTKASHLAKKMQESSLFSMDEKSKVQQWLSELEQMDVNDREDVSTQLVFLLSDVIHPAIAHALRVDKQLLDFEDQLKEILGPMLPANKSIDSFIEECQAFDNKCLIFYQKCAATEACYQAQTQPLCTSANGVSDGLVQNFEMQNQFLQQIETNRKEGITPVHASLAEAQQKVDLLYRKAPANATKVKSVGQKLENEKHLFQQIVQQGKEVFKKKRL